MPSCYSATLAEQNKVVQDLIYFPLAVWLTRLEWRHSRPVTPAVTQHESTRARSSTAERCEEAAKVTFAVMSALIDCDAHKLHRVRVYLMNTEFKRRLTLNCRSCFARQFYRTQRRAIAAPDRCQMILWQLPSSFDMQCVSLHDGFVSSRCHLTIVSCRNREKRRLKPLSYCGVLCTHCLNCCSVSPRARQERCIYLT